MSLRIIRSSVGTGDVAAPKALTQGTQREDGWGSRIAKLIPAEALGLYGAGSAVAGGKALGLWILAAACLVLSGVLRYRATQDPATGSPQWSAVIIAVISFTLWVVALEPPAGPIELGENAYLAAIFALIWGAAVPAFYKGDPAS
ncbi:MAG: hypothetical protein MI755_20195 [Sphingomonadales bacterium]|nr:hypothetical protein [Sphingomonadales bacterium]